MLLKLPSTAGNCSSVRLMIFGSPFPFAHGMTNLCAIPRVGGIGLMHSFGRISAKLATGPSMFTRFVPNYYVRGRHI